jgi:NitT/TauT family transport system substrate-binding protein
MKTVTSIANQAVFDLPWLVAQQEGLFAQEDLEVVFLPQTPWDAQRPPEHNPGQVPPFWQYMRFEEQQAAAFNACEWGQVRRAQASAVGGRIVTLRPALVSQAIIVRPDSPLTHVQALRHKTIAVNFHAGSHYLTLQLLEGFMEREAITVVHVGQAPGRYRAMWEGRVDAATVMEPYIALAEKQGCAVLAEGVYVGAEILAPSLDTETAQRMYRAITQAVRLINADKVRYLHHLIAELPADLGTLTPADFHLPRLRYTVPRPYPPEEFRHTYAWMVSWGLIPAGMAYENLVDNRIGGMAEALQEG